jgi:hypothetical protein
MAKGRTPINVETAPGPSWTANRKKETQMEKFRNGDLVYNPYIGKYACVLGVRPNDQILVVYEDARDNPYLVRAWLLQPVADAEIVEASR